MRYFIQPKIDNERLKVGLGRNVPVTPAVVKADPWWLADPHRKAYTEQSVFGPTLPHYWAFNPAYAEVQNTHVWSTAWADIMRNGMTPGGGGGARHTNRSRRSSPNTRSSRADGSDLTVPQLLCGAH